MSAGSKNLDDNNFSDLFGDAEPLRGAEREVLRSTAAISLGQQQRRRDAELARLPDRGLSTADIPMLAPGAWLSWCRPGVQHGVYRKLRLGHYPADARLDLHGMNVEQARIALLQFVRECRAHDLRCVLLAHGTGAHRASPAILKSCLAHWLPQLDDVLAFHSAQRQHGGPGASYVLLKKGERQRRQTFEEHSRRNKR